MSHPDLADRLARVRERIAERQAAAGWSHPVRIVAVTKGHGPDTIRSALAAGLAEVGENRVQEARAKQDALAGLDVAWHLIGSLQRNKARHAVGRFALIHSVDREDLVAELARRCLPGMVQPVLVEVNCSGEAQKGGVEPAMLEALVDRILGGPGLRFDGLMTMAELSDDAAVQRRAFRRLRELRDALERAGHRVRELSMGMSGDYPVAVEEGATMVRLGTVLFGERAT
jgi:PLP dependent protein